MFRIIVNLPVLLYCMHTSTRRIAFPAAPCGFTNLLCAFALRSANAKMTVNSGAVPFSPAAHNLPWSMILQFQKGGKSMATFTNQAALAYNN
ncbi:MAG: hypothetical protein Q4D43_01225, partial [Clostridia bacterium]|nr:hypothetical protein [Clostridia bacterium]